MALAPIVIFCYNRPSLLKQTIESLQCNLLADKSDLIVYCDGPKIGATQETLNQIELVRAYCDSITGFKSVSVVKALKNKGLQVSVIEGLNKTFETYSSAIVVEDDVVTSQYFLDFMNAALIKYDYEDKVLSIGSWNYYYQSHENFFNHLPDTIAWATWKNRWTKFESDGKILYDKLVNHKLMDKFNLSGNFDFQGMLKQQYEGKVSSWAIRWTALAVLNDTLTLYPKISLSKHIGFGKDSTNCEDEDFNMNLLLAQQSISQFDIDIKENSESIAKFIEFEKTVKKSPATSITTSTSLHRRIQSKFLKMIPNTIKQFVKLYLLKSNTVSKVHGWFGDYESWSDALTQTSGYDELSILNKIKESILKVKRGEAQYERDSIAFNDFEYSTELLNALKYAVKDNKLSLIDFGGSLGSQYFQYKRFFDTIDVNWMVVEQSHFVDCGKKDIADNQLNFFHTIDEALKYKEANTILLSSVLPYIKEPFELIQKIVSYKFDYIIIDRNPFIDMNRDLITVQIVPEFVYKASYPSWFFYEEKFLEAFKNKYTIIKAFDSPFAAPMLVNNVQACWKGFILKKI